MDTKKLLRMYFAALTILLVCGCSTGGSAPPVYPDNTPGFNMASGITHQSWGLWQFSADPKMEMLDVVQLRTGDFHLNALPFLEPPALVNLTLESLEWNGNIIETDIGLRHPFLGLTEFTGFDVCGILITNGTMTGFNDTSIVMAGNSEDTYLMNPDGYSPWWNPTNFPPDPANPISGYVDGLLGAPDSYANYNSTICGYKYFADDLTPDESLETLDLGERGMFSAGQKNIRHYTIHLGDEGLIFNYAIDACWEFPMGDLPWMAPESFSISTNRPEAFNITVTETVNTLYYVDGEDHGGDLELDVMVYDWQGPGTIQSAGVEWPGLFDYTEETEPVETTEHTATYHFQLSGDNLTSSAPVDIFITAKDTVTEPALGNIPNYWMVGGFEVSDESLVVLEERIVYTANRNVFSIDPEGLTDPVEWTTWEPGSLCEGPVLSPDGQYIVYMRFDMTFCAELRRIDVVTGEDISITGMSNFYWYPSWRNDSQKIICAYGDTWISTFELYTMDPDGGNKELLFSSSIDIIAPVYSPDDEYVYFQDFSPCELYIYEIDTGTITKYTENTSHVDPDPSPDGTQLAWATSYGGSGYSIYISPIDSWFPPDKVIQVDTYCRHPSFSPDGTKMTFDHGAYDAAEIAVYDLSDDSWFDLTNNSWADGMADWGVMIISE